MMEQPPFCHLSVTVQLQFSFRIEIMIVQTLIQIVKYASFTNSNILLKNTHNDNEYPISPNTLILINSNLCKGDFFLLES